MTPLLLLELCQAFEIQYNMASSDFYRRYLSGKFVGIHNAYRWAGYWKAYLSMKQEPNLVDKGTSQELLTATG